MNAKTKLAQQAKLSNCDLPKGYRVEYTDLKNATPDINSISVTLHYNKEQIYYDSYTTYAAAIRSLEQINRIVYRLNMHGRLK